MHLPSLPGMHQPCATLQRQAPCGGESPTLPLGPTHPNRCVSSLSVLAPLCCCCAALPRPRACVSLSVVVPRQPFNLRASVRAWRQRASQQHRQPRCNLHSTRVACGVHARLCRLRYAFLLDVHMDSGRLSKPFVSSLGAFWPGMQALVGERAASRGERCTRCTWCCKASAFAGHAGHAGAHG